MDLELHILCRVSTMIIMTELDSSTFFHAQSRSDSNPKNLVSRKWSTGVVRGPRV